MASLASISTLSTKWEAWTGQAGRCPPPPAPLTPSSRLLHLARPSLPPCCLLQTTTCRDMQFGEASGAPHPWGLPQMGSQVRRHLGAQALGPHLTHQRLSSPPLPPPLRCAPGRLCQRSPPLDLSPSWTRGGTLRSHLLVHDGASQLLHMGQLGGCGQQHELAGQPDLDVEGDPGARGRDMGQQRWRRLQFQAAGGQRRPWAGRAREPSGMGGGGGHRARPGTSRPSSTRDPAGGAWAERLGSLGPRNLVSWWLDRGDPGALRRETWQVEGTGGW